ncbi:XRE family transcriptional regulator [Limosilactobacillus reuteri]|uniref:LexA family protein n=1 Tax=Limosilactobacillus reuteri TaxID=1598 RepID=UPI0004D44273|nr:XRE family transcriptional regulator [Limosilactobacillus reuteri]KEQ20534.1 XRE family transcriptional regulator [Limosilactobacillus reuteri]MRI02886.1 helix-turn-helix domain-containing protein [Limosilactobacillus reuteri]
MNTFQSRLKEALANSGLSQAELARRANIGRNSISDYLKGKYEAKQDKLHSLARVLNVDEGWLMGYDISQERNSNSKVPTNIIYPLGDKFQRVSIPLIGEIACGDPITAEENIEGYVEEIFEKPVPKGNLFALRCKGKSMEPTIHDGSIVTIREQPTVEDGEIAAVLVDGDNEATLKRVKHQGNLIMLMPDNKEFDPIILDKDNPGRIVGKAVHVSWSIK